MEIDKKTWGVLGLITLIGVILRIYQLGFQCFWLEEIYTINLAKKPILDVITTSLFVDCNPPVYYIAAHISMAFLGLQEVAIRYPSLVCGILIIPAMYLLGTVFKNKMTGIYCAGITAALYPLTYYSQFGRAYSMAFLFFIIAVIFYVKLWEDPASKKNMVYFAVMAALTVWTHLFAIIPIGLLILNLLLKKNIIKGILTGTLFFALIAPLYPIIGGTQGRGTGYGMSLIEVLVITPTEFFSTLFPFIGMFFCVGAYQEKDRTITGGLIIVTILTVIIGTICSILTPTFPRYFMTVSFIIILMCACACENTLSALKWSDNAKIALVLSVMGIMLAIQYPEFITHYLKQKYSC